MSRLVATLGLATVWTLWGAGMALLYLAGVVLAAALWFAIRPPSLRRTPATVRRLPTQHERRWSVGLGLAITWFGPIPFVSIRRRMR